MKKRFLLILGLVSILAVAACAPAAPKMELPEGAVQLSPVVPAMGEHWANPAQLPLGPIYMVYKGEVIGLEYMWTEDMMQEISIPPNPLEPEGLDLSALVPLPVGVTVNYVDVAFMHHGHAGMEGVPHWDMHLYFIPKAEVDAITPGG